jgi:radical SAM-linked protein
MLIARIKYSKLYPANLVGHLDTAASIMRGIRMAAWPVKFSCGFNPRMKVSFTPPLSLGFKSDSEYVDVELSKHLEEYQIERFKDSMIKGINIIDVKELNTKRVVGINEKLEGFSYEIEILQEDITKISGEFKIIAEGEKNYIFMDVFKESGGFKNPLKILGEGEYRVKKSKCHWNTAMEGDEIE